MYLLSVPSVSSRYFNKIKRTSYLGKYPALSQEILSSNWVIIMPLGENVAYLSQASISTGGLTFSPS